MLPKIQLLPIIMAIIIVELLQNLAN